MISNVIRYAKNTAIILAGTLITSNCSENQTDQDTSKKFITSDSRPSEKEELGQYIFKLMDIVESPLSESMKIVVSRAIVDVSFDIFSNQQDRKQFAVLISIESKFNNKVRSSASAVGITQVIPKYAKFFGEKCGFKNVTNDDIEDMNINLILGACHFRSLLDALKQQL